MIINDLFDSNANNLFAELQLKISRLQSVLSSAEPGGDFAETVKAQLKITKAAFQAARAQYNQIISPPIAPSTCVHGQGEVTWAEKLSDATEAAGRDLTYKELKMLVHTHCMTAHELEDWK